MISDVNIAISIALIYKTVSNEDNNSIFNFKCQLEQY